MKVYELKCNNCGADLKVSDDRKVIFCEYCGSKNLIAEQVIRSEVKHSSTVVYRDEAKLRELDIQEQERRREEKKRNRTFKRWYFISIGSFVVLFFLGFGGEYFYELNEIAAPVLIICSIVIPFFYPYSYYGNKKGRSILVFLVIAILLILCFALGEIISGEFFSYDLYRFILHHKFSN